MGETYTREQLSELCDTLAEAYNNKDARGIVWTEMAIVKATMQFHGYLWQRGKDCYARGCAK